MMEANPAKYYVAKFFFLFFAIIQWLVTTAVLTQFPFGSKTFFIALIFFTLGLISFFIFIIVSKKIKRVVVGKNKIVVLEGDRNLRFEWPEIKSLRIIPYFNIYKMKIKGKRNSIYFFPSQNIDPAFGLLSKDTSRMGDLVEKRKKEFGIK